MTVEVQREIEVLNKALNYESNLVHHETATTKSVPILENENQNAGSQSENLLSTTSACLNLLASHKECSTALDDRHATVENVTGSFVTGPEEDTEINEAMSLLAEGQMPANFETVLALNQTYQDMIEQFLQRADTLLSENRDRQRQLCDLMNEGSDATPGRHGLAPVSKVPSTMYIFPYFRDSAGMCPPPNRDTVRKAETGEYDAQVGNPKRWFAMDRKKLTKGVKDNILEKLIEPLIRKREIIEDKLRAVVVDEETLAGLDEANALRDTGNAIDNEVKRIQEMPDSQLLTINCDIDWTTIANHDMELTRTPEQCESMWTQQLCPSINQDPQWKTSELYHMKRLVKSKVPWDEIAVKLRSRRTAFQCFEKFQELRRLDGSIDNRAWTSSEDKILAEVVETCRLGSVIPWDQISYYMDGRSTADCRARWLRRIDPELKIGAWQESEDMMLIAAVHKVGVVNDWHRVAQLVPGRNNNQCRARWTGALDQGLKSGPWTPEEDARLLFLDPIFNNNDSRISKLIPGRARHAVSDRRKFLHRSRNNVDDVIIECDDDDGPTTSDSKACSSIKKSKLQDRKHAYRRATLAEYAIKDVSKELIRFEHESTTGKFNKQLKDMRSKYSKRASVHKLFQLSGGTDSMISDIRSTASAIEQLPVELQRPIRDQFAKIRNELALSAEARENSLQGIVLLSQAECAIERKLAFLIQEARPTIGVKRWDQVSEYIRRSIRSAFSRPDTHDIMVKALAPCPVTMAAFRRLLMETPLLVAKALTAASVISARGPSTNEAEANDAEDPNGNVERASSVLLTDSLEIRPFDCFSANGISVDEQQQLKRPPESGEAGTSDQCPPSKARRMSTAMNDLVLTDNVEVVNGVAESSTNAATASPKRKNGRKKPNQSIGSIQPLSVGPDWLKELDSRSSDLRTLRSVFRSMMLWPSLLCLKQWDGIRRTSKRLATVDKSYVNIDDASDDEDGDAGIIQTVDHDADSGDEY